MLRPALFQAVELALIGGSAKCLDHFTRAGDVGWALVALIVLVSSAVQFGMSAQRDGLFGWRR